MNISHSISLASSRMIGVKHCIEVSNESVKKRRVVLVKHRCAMERITEDAVFHNILQFLTIKEHVQMQLTNKDWNGRVRTLHVPNLDISACVIDPNNFLKAIQSIMHKYRSATIINCSAQYNLVEKDFIELVAVYWKKLEHIIVDDCDQLGDRALYALVCSSSNCLKSISMRRCKRVEGSFEMNSTSSMLTSLDTLELGDTSLQLDRAEEIQAKFHSRVMINAMNTPAHYQIFTSLGWNDLLPELSNFADRDEYDPKPLVSLCQEFESRRRVVSQQSCVGGFVQHMLKQGTRFLGNAPLEDDYFTTALMVASENGNLDQMRLLLETTNADIDATDKEGAAALYRSVTSGSFKRGASIKLLLKHGADPGRHTVDHTTPFTAACEYDCCDIVRIMLEYHAENKTTFGGVATGMHIASRCGHDNVLRVILEYSDSIGRIHRDDLTTAMFVACENGHTGVAKYLLQHGVSANTTIGDNISPLYVACQAKKPDIVAMLIEYGADVNIRRENGVPCLYIAAQEGNPEVVTLLLKNGVNIHDRMQDDATALHIAIRMGHLDVVKVLLSFGADVNASTSRGLTALFIACQEGHVELTKYLIDMRADLEVQIYDGASPLFVASQNGHDDIVLILLQAGASTENAKKNKAAPLHVAAQMGHRRVVELLLEAGAEVNTYSTAGGSPLHFANRFGHTDLYKMLYKYSLKDPAPLYAMPQILLQRLPKK